MKRHALPLLLIILFPILGALAGRGAAPWFAKSDYIVQVAERVWYEESNAVAERTLQSAAFRATGMPLETLYAQARDTRNRFLKGGIWLGIWCGLAAGLKIASLYYEKRRSDYLADRSRCLACGRCYQSCPIEHKRLKGLAE